MSTFQSTLNNNINNLQLGFLKLTSKVQKNYRVACNTYETFSDITSKVYLCACKKFNNSLPSIRTNINFKHATGVNT